METTSLPVAAGQGIGLVSDPLKAVAATFFDDPQVFFEFLPQRFIPGLKGHGIDPPRL